jgi:hypothetical protein
MSSPDSWNRVRCRSVQRGEHRVDAAVERRVRVDHRPQPIDRDLGMNGYGDRAEHLTSRRAITVAPRRTPRSASATTFMNPCRRRRGTIRASSSA